MTHGGNFFALLKARFDAAADRPFLTLPDGRGFSYGDMDALSAKMAGALKESGAVCGDRILAQIEKSPENVALYFGAMRAGLVYTPLNTAYTTEEVAYFLSDAAPAVFVCSPEKAAALAPVAENAGVKRTLTLGVARAGTLCDALEAGPCERAVHPRGADDLAVILYTSGTTGRSKGAMLTHGNLASNAVALNDLWGFTPKDVLLHALPVFHIHGLFVALHTAMLSGCEVLFLPKFDVDGVRKALPRASVMMGVPTFYARLLGDPGFNADACAHMRLFISGSAPLTEDAFNAFAARSGHKILERYGMSEAGMIASNPLRGERVAGSVGFLLPGVSARIAGDAPAEIEIKGPNVFKGYWKKPEQTAEAFTQDGFFKTGDVGGFDAQGRLTLMGRSKDLIIAGGYNIYPKEVEQVLDAVPGVVESAVIGVPHPDMGEGVAAVLVAEDGAVDEAVLNDALAALARFKRPRKFFQLDALPRNAMGKVQKQVLRKRFKSAFCT